MDGSYFNSIEEADEWLDFDASDDECDLVAFEQEDRYVEWTQWRLLWEASGPKHQGSSEAPQP